jgi:hypothetical protein
VKQPRRNGKSTQPGKRREHVRVATPEDPFITGAMILATLNNPREKYWGALLGISAAGISMIGVELASVDDCTNMMISGEQFAAPVVFFPMHRVERIELDTPQGTIPSLSQRFSARTGHDASSVFAQLSGAKNRSIGNARS